MEMSSNSKSVNRIHSQLDMPTSTPCKTIRNEAIVTVNATFILLSA